MIVVAYYLVQWFGFISGLGIYGLLWLLSMDMLTEKLISREIRKYPWGRQQNA